MKGMKASFCFIVIIAQAVAASSFSPSPSKYAANQKKQKQFSAKSIPNLPPAKKSTLNLSAVMLVRGGADVALKSFYGDALGKLEHVKLYGVAFEESREYMKLLVLMRYRFFWGYKDPCNISSWIFPCCNLYFEGRSNLPVD